MADIPSIPSVLPNTSTPAPVTPAAPAPTTPQATLEDLPVRQAPPALTKAEKPAPVEGKVVSSNPQTQQIRIMTAQGEIEVQSQTPLPPDTKVMVQVFTDKARMLANIVILSQAAVESKQLEKIVTPPAPKLQEGHIVTAILLPDTEVSPDKSAVVPHPPRLSAGPLPLPKGEGIESPSQLLPLPTGYEAVEGASYGRGEGERDIASAHDVKKFISAYLPQVFGRPQMTATPHSEAPDAQDSSLLKIITSQLKTKTEAPASPPAPAAKQPSAPLPPPMQNIMNTLLAAVESLKPQPATAVPQPQAPLPKNMYQLSIIKILPPETPPQKIDAALQQATKTEPQSVQAKIDSITPSGFPMVKTATNNFVIKTPVEIPPGSILILKAAPMTAEQIIADPALRTTAAPQRQFEPLTDTTWPALQEALQTVQQSSSPVMQALHRSLPSPSKQLVPTALFFLAALRSGAIENWLGTTVLKALQESGRKDLAERLGSDFSKLSSQSKESLAEDWRSISMPLMHDENLSQLQFYVRQQYDRDSNEQAGGQKPATRFILNLSLSRMGKMQLDGFIQKKQFDMVLRSEEKLPFDIRQELMKRFAQGLEQVNMQGGISFQARQGWVNVELPPHGAQLV